MKMTRNILLYTSWFTFVWAVVCWFSGPHETDFLGLEVFSQDPFWLLVLSLVLLVAGLTIKQLLARKEQSPSREQENPTQGTFVPESYSPCPYPSPASHVVNGKWCE